VSAGREGRGDNPPPVPVGEEVDAAPGRDAKAAGLSRPPPHPVATAIAATTPARRAVRRPRRAVVEARVATPRGDIFTPRVAAYVQRQLQIAAHRASLTEIDVTAVALERLPLLPMELEYRFVDRDLVILDTEIDLVVDVLENALPPETGVKSGPCAVHPDLEMCWS